MNSSANWKMSQLSGPFHPPRIPKEAFTYMYLNRSGKTHFYSATSDDVRLAVQYSASHGGPTPGKDDNMYTQLWRCGICGWGTFEHDHPRKLMAGQLRDGLGEHFDICEECINFLQTAPKYELDPKILNPTRKVKE